MDVAVAVALPKSHTAINNFMINAEECNRMFWFYGLNFNGNLDAKKNRFANNLNSTYIRFHIN